MIIIIIIMHTPRQMNKPILCVFSSLIVFSLRSQGARGGGGGGGENVSSNFDSFALLTV